MVKLVYTSDGLTLKIIIPTCGLMRVKSWVSTTMFNIEDTFKKVVFACVHCMFDLLSYDYKS